MSEEKKVIEYLKTHIIPVNDSKGEIEYLLNDIILNLIEKLQKQLEVQKNTNKNLAKENQKYNDNLMDLESEIANNYVPKSKIQNLINIIIKEENFCDDNFDRLFEKETKTNYEKAKIIGYLFCQQELSAIRGTIEELLEE